MADLSTSYMGLELKSPVVPSASPLSRELDNIKKMEDAGAGAVVLYSLFEEQIDQEAEFLDHMIEDVKYRYAEMIDLFPPQEEYRRDEKEYLELIRKAKKAVDIPIIPSLNGYGMGGWLRYAALFEEAGADAVELNVYYLPTSHRLTGAQVESQYFEILREVVQQVDIPVAVKLGPFFSSIPHVATLLDRGGAEALVLFNRFYQPDFDIENLESVRRLTLSSSPEMLLPLRWIAILYGKLNASMALTTGIHTADDVVKAILAGADVANVCSVLLKKGIGELRELVTGLEAWMDEHEYASIKKMKGILSHQKSPNPSAFERANYVQLVGQSKA
jgi:dihydroorotate dehydrogenase (fumarate)